MLTHGTSKRALRSLWQLAWKRLLHPLTKTLKSQHKPKENCFLLSRLLGARISDMGLRHIPEPGPHPALQLIDMG